MFIDFGSVPPHLIRELGNLGIEFIIFTVINAVLCSLKSIEAPRRVLKVYVTDINPLRPQKPLEKLI
ncbi:hypothetical protein [Thermococcus sp.]|uniref:hypothetical protein n=1 Tax=Thermococcus sp. TaxID=35749 RepID=UPI0026251F79|nr:hypothetical protein [Thermococcus sp.]